MMEESFDNKSVKGIDMKSKSSNGSFSFSFFGIFKTLGINIFFNCNI